LTTADEAPNGEAPIGSVAIDQTKIGLKVSPIESVTLSDEEGQENAHSAAVYRKSASSSPIIT